MELNVFINFVEPGGESGTLQALDTPQMQLELKSNASSYRLAGKITERALVVVYLVQSQLDPVVAEQLTQLLGELHQLQIVFVCREEPTSWQQQEIFTYCYQSGFLQVLLMHRSSLYTYQPYPSIQAVELFNISEYLARERKIRNFYGFPIRTIITNISPRDFFSVDHNNRLVRTGYLYHGLKEFTVRYNATLVEVPLPKGGVIDRYEGVIELLFAREIDFVSYPRDLIWPVQSTVPFSILNEYLLVPHAPPIARYLYFAKPFGWSLWLILVATVFYVTIMLFAVRSGRQGRQMGVCFLRSLSHFLYISNHETRISVWQDLLTYLILTLSGFILTNVYLAMLSSMLTSGLYEPQYTTLESLAKAPYPTLHDDYYLATFRTKTFLPEPVLRNSLSTDVPTLEKLRNGLDNRYMYCLYEDRMELLFRQQYLLKTPRSKVIRQSIGAALESYVVSNRLPYLRVFNEYARRIQEHGILDKMKMDTWRIMIKTGLLTLMRDEEPASQAYDLEFYFIAFFLWAAGLTLSVLVFVLELVKQRHHNRS
ncbi:uncharacterized protein LOC117592347 [Drosophila guanche]|uniref:Ionotropic glutamate receptor C-terminal domain-containing protein n=1 Tax=Drosophila guanche TaxID=7266 RepID=A0A3B0JQA8_DROGU|nr:uncharacterized protein LOC117592347 [Drosophila guanche]SPP73348.1 Hypothetical predicted protein [Drosophila guanche]